MFGLWPEERRKEGKVLFNNALSTFYLWLYGVGHMVKNFSVREETCYCHCVGYSFQLASRGSFIYTTNSIAHTTWPWPWYTRCGALAGTRNSSMGPPSRINLITPHTMSRHSNTKINKTSINELQKDGKLMILNSRLNLQCVVCAKYISSASWDRSHETLISSHISARWHLSSKMNTTKWPFPDLWKDNENHEASQKITYLDDNESWICPTPIRQ